MSANHDISRVVRSWIREEEHDSADHVLQVVLSRLDSTPQRRPLWAARRSAQMNKLLPATLAAAAVLVVAVVGYNLLPRTTQPGQPGSSSTAVPTLTPSLDPTPVPTEAPTVRPLLPSEARVLTEGPLAAGTYVADPFPALGWRFLFTLPDGWHGAPPNAVTPAAGASGPTGAAVAVLRPLNLYVNPCLNHTQGPAVPTGFTVDELVDALAEVTSFEEPPYTMTAPTATAIGGFEGQRLDLLLPSDVDFATCQDETFWVWDGGPYAQGPGNRWHLWILNIDGTRFVIFAQDFETTSAEDRADLEAIVSSLRFER